MSKPGDLIYVPSDAPIICGDKRGEVLYLDKPGYYIVCEQSSSPGDSWGTMDMVAILYNGAPAWVMSKHIKKEF